MCKEYRAKVDIQQIINADRITKEEIVPKNVDQGFELMIIYMETVDGVVSV